MVKVTGLSGNEIYCLALKNYSAGELVVSTVASPASISRISCGF